MTPMIDVVFLLLVFFVWTSSFEVPEFDLPSAIAEPPAGQSQLSDERPTAEVFDEIVIRLSMQDARLIIELGGQPLQNTAALKSRMVEILALGVQPPVIVDPAEQVTMNVAVEVYDVVRSAGADRVLFATRGE
jgi:biopolymer transport protein ExbD